MQQTNDAMGEARPLSGIRVLDFTRVLAGPYCTALLADLGAEIIKIEPPQGDDYRHIGPFYPDGSSSLFECANRGKKSLVLDLSTAEDRERARLLAARCDVLVENYRPGVAERLGIGWTTLSSDNERLVYASISGFGQSGPNAHRPAYDFIVQAMSGIMSITGSPDGPAMPVGESIADISAGLFASWAILAALVERERTGRGRHIDMGMFDAMIALQPTMVARYAATGDVPHRVGNRHALSAPFGAFRAKDGDVMITVLNGKLFQALAACMEMPSLADDTRFRSDTLRLKNEAALRAIIEKWLANLAVDEAVERLIRSGVPASAVCTIADALSSPQSVERKVTQQAHHPRLGAVTLPEQPARFSGVARGQTRRAPELNEHRREILALIGENETAVSEGQISE